MRRQHDRLLASQQSRQHRPPAGCQVAREIGGQQREWPRQDVREDQVVAAAAQSEAAIPGGTAYPHKTRDLVARDIMAGDRDRPRIDVARQHPAAQQLGGAASGPMPN